MAKRIDENRLTPLVLVQAPAGYGKTSLMTEWFGQIIRDGETAVWLSIDHNEQTALDFFVAILMAMHHANIPIAPVRDILTTEGFTTPRTLSIATNNLLVSLERPIHLFLDDVHLLKGRPSEEGLHELVQGMPHNLHLIVASRELPSLPLGKMRARGRLAEFYAQDLRFTSAETRELLDGEGHTDLASEDVDEIRSCTEGWVSGLRLASIALKDAGSTKLIRSGLTGRRRAIEAFFAEEVLARQTTEIQDFLLKTAPLSQMCASLADTVTGTTNGRRMIVELEKLGLFISSLDDEGVWYRYHHLFSDFLLRRLEDVDPNMAAQICSKASAWFDEKGHVADAFNHAIRGNDIERAAGIFDRRCLTLAYGGELGLLAGLAAQIPSAALARFPCALITLAWLSITGWRFVDAGTALTLARARIEQMKRSSDVDLREVRQLDYLLLHRELMLAVFMDDMGEAQTYLDAIMAFENHHDEYLIGTVATSEIYIAAQKFGRINIPALSSEATVNYERNGSNYVAIWHQTVVGIAYLRAGDIERANAAFDEAHRQGGQFGDERSRLAGIATPLQAEAYYLAGRLEEAKALLADHHAVASEIGHVDQLVARFKVLVRLKEASGDLTAVDRLLADNAALAASYGFERLRLAVAVEAVRYQIREGRSDLIGRYIREGDIADTLDKHSPYGGITTIGELKALLAVRMAQLTGSYSEGARLARRWKEFAQRNGWFMSATEWGILAAQMEVLNGERLKAFRSLREVIEINIATTLVSPFISEGDVIVSVLREHVAHDSPVDRFILNLLAHHVQKLGHLPAGASSAEAPDDFDLSEMMDALNSKEVEILKLVGNGRMNREIATSLGLTEGTIKWYLNRIYAKIGVSRRAQAVKRARQLGLIH
ncbi:LuxR family maltose regulon positive regulatory protein [Sphingomonas sp. PP-F2F-A104-K0414]|nr:LuxR family maltose regulon positive regulatory protein [Sphingomonas sp. PP-F2F-A104-K0414]